MKNLKKLSREELKNVSGGKIAPDSGGCESGHGCACGAIYNNFGGPAHWDCCRC
ncbi:bacteriocin-type signal sequence-containing protein [Chryseobacterium piscicola]|uniref:Bacteriocin-type signal sequence-containing protein n=1 Tax=Chryseobacterium piscicola TaxID=551459 RepID=A0A1N7KRZ9_9FLAO|nr:bacteriocin-type signal sequence-containing protein [Chryseobacterium piscicola]